MIENTDDTDDERPPNDRKARAIRERDNNQCRLCGKSEADGVTIEFHRLVPRSAENGERLSNYLLLCEADHARVDNRHPAHA